MTGSQNTAKTIFLNAVEIASAPERQAYLDAQCGGDQSLRREVEQLLAHFEAQKSFLESPAPGIAPTADLQAEPTSPPESIGTMIGPYKLLEQIGEGGFGVVYLAEQTEPVRRKVALKILKPGMDTRQIVARFEAERQALAIMDHPNIAKVFDGGSTEPAAQARVSAKPLACAAGSGRPYFVMELVKGIPITEYCDQNHLTPRQRLELFIPVCQAVQHAHQKGIIHRDLKPSNVLVTRHDSVAVPKVIDFGVAKALGQELTDKTLFTGIAQMIGTPLYMSPEQAGMSDLDVDTRSDIYSLGVLLYELLTGTTPFEKERFKKAAYDEIRRIIREEEPPKPSTRLSNLGTPLAPRVASDSRSESSTISLASVSAVRQTEPAKLTKLVKGELDWIVMKALEKDRNRRYETANGLAMDVQRYLTDEPVLAGPPSAAYRLRKFARRNRRALAVTGLILVLVASLGGAGAWVIRDRAVRRAKATNDLQLALDRAELLHEQGKVVDARAAFDAVEVLAGAGEASRDLDNRRSALKEKLDAAERDAEFVSKFEEIRLRVETRVDVTKSRFSPEAAFPEIRDLLGRYGITIGVTEPAQVAARIQTRPEPVRRSLVASLDECLRLATFTHDLQARQWLLAARNSVDVDPWRARAVKAVVDHNWETLQQQLRQVDLRTQAPSFLLLLVELFPERMRSARLELAHRVQRAYPNDVWANIILANELIPDHRYAEASRYLTAALALRPDNAGLYLNRANSLSEMGDKDGAIADYRQCLALAPRYAVAMSNLAGVLRTQGKLKEALDLCDQAIATDSKLALAWANRGLVQIKLGEYEKAVADNTTAIGLDDKLAGAWANRGEAQRLLGRIQESIVDCTRAIKLDENSPSAFANRADCYLRIGDYKRALADSSQAVKLDQTDAYAWYVRGGAYSGLGNHDQAIADCSKAVEIDRMNPWTHYNLGTCLTEKGEFEKAIQVLRKAIKLDDKFAEAHCNLAGALQQIGRFQEALKEMRYGDELGRKRPGWQYQSQDWVKNCERLVALDARLPDFRAHKAMPAGPEERIELAKLCALKRLYSAAASFYDEAFTPISRRTAPLIGANRYHAACMAALAGCGRGNEADKLDEKDRARWRRQSLEWLRESLRTVGRLLERSPDKIPALARTLEDWLKDPDLAGVRGAEAIAKLPEAERADWQKFWQDVADMLKHAQQKGTPEKKSK